jgi:NitT/TauT family transport system substrate-binding protein
MKIIFAMLIGLLVLVLLGCTPAEETPETSGEVMKVSEYNWPGQWWKVIAQEKGWFEEAGLNIDLVDTNADYFASLDAMAEGDMDSNSFVLFDLINYNIDGKNLVAVTNVDDSNGIEGILVKPGINSIGELKGKRIGVHKNGYTNYILSTVLIDNGVDDVNLVDVSVGENIAEGFLKGDFDAFIAWEPELSSGLEMKGSSIIWDTSKIDGISPGVDVFNRQFIEERPEDVQAYVNVWAKTASFMDENKQESWEIIAEFYGKTVDEISSLEKLDRLLNLKDNKIAFSYAAGFESLHGTARQINNFMIEKGVTDKKLDPLDFIDSRFIRNVE